METKDHTNWEIEVSFKESEESENVYSFTFDPSLYMEPVICSRGDFTFGKVEEIVDDRIEELDIDKEIGVIYDIQVKEVKKFKQMSNPGWKD